MKATSILLLSLGTLALLGACQTTDPNPSIDEGETLCTLHFETNGGSAIAPLQVRWGEKASAPKDPVKAGYRFQGWYVDEVLVTPFDWTKTITSDWLLYAAYSLDASSSSVPDPETSSSSSETPEESFTLYFRDASWWNAYAAATYVKIDGAGETSLGTRMTHLRFCPVKSESVGYNYWSITIPNAASVTGVQFFRGGGDDPENPEDWNAHTAAIPLSSREENNLYDIKDAAESWGKDFLGAWSTYDASDNGPLA